MPLSRNFPNFACPQAFLPSDDDSQTVPQRAANRRPLSLRLSHTSDLPKGISRIQTQHPNVRNPLSFSKKKNLRLCSPIHERECHQTIHIFDDHSFALKKSQSSSVMPRRSQNGPEKADAARLQKAENQPTKLPTNQN
jgi:hypothetical protein